QILSEVESRRKQRQAQQQKPEEEKAELPALPIRDLGGTALPRLLELVDAPDPATRASALAALPATTVPAPMRMAVVRKLLVALDDEDLRVVRVAAGSLGRLKALAAQEKLIALLNIEDPDPAVAAIDALAEIGSALALPALEQLAGLDQGTVAGAAARAVATIRLATPATPAASSRASRP
ncbi:MAG: HEAT repeat domain-containing protein, partial [Candidatus Wallbacteria bacterium]|nr:HEAT repeat domain-containing protein [Candidatus Wallbacteria bacterium]